MKISLLIVVSCLVLACTDHSGKTSSGRRTSSKSNSFILPDGSEIVERDGLSLEDKIRLIKSKCDSTDQFYDEMGVNSKNVRGTDGVGTGSYYYVEDKLQMIRFYPDDNSHGERYYHFYLDKGKLICGRLIEEYGFAQSNEKSKAKKNTVVANFVPVNGVTISMDSVQKINCVLNCYFKNGEIFYRELINKSKKKHSAAQIEKEKKRMKEEFELLMKEA